MGLIIARRRQFNNRSNDPYGITLTDTFVSIGARGKWFWFLFFFLFYVYREKIRKKNRGNYREIKIFEWKNPMIGTFNWRKNFVHFLLPIDWGSNGRIKMLLRWSFDVWILIVWVFVKGLDLVDLFGIWIWWKMEYEAMVYEFNGNLMEKCSLLNWKRIYLIKYIKIYG